MQNTPIYAKDANLCKIHQSMQKMQIYAKEADLCKKKPGPWAITGKN